MTPFDRQPYIQIETDLWAVMREPKDRPRAMIMRVTDWQQIEKYLVLTWHPEPHRRRLVSMHDTFEKANTAVRWDVSTRKTGRENHHWGGEPGVKTHS